MISQKDIQLITTALKARGFSNKQIEQQIANFKKQNISLDEMFNHFINVADKDPHSIASKNCESGKCCAIDIDKEGN
ncbi:MAG: hypothetical protein L3I91_02180 [Mycoplasma sp.]